MTKPIPDKAEVALELPDKLYIGTFERSSRVLFLNDGPSPGRRRPDLPMRVGPRIPPGQGSASMSELVVGAILYTILRFLLASQPSNRL
jgi:hypothetical protein